MGKVVLNLVSRDTDISHVQALANSPSFSAVTSAMASQQTKPEIRPAASTSTQCRLPGVMPIVRAGSR